MMRERTARRAAMLAAFLALGCGATSAEKGGDHGGANAQGGAGAVGGSQSGGATLLGGGAPARGGASAMSGAGAATLAGKGGDSGKGGDGGSQTSGAGGRSDTLGGSGGADAGRAGGDGGGSGDGGATSARGGGEQAGHAGAGGAAGASNAAAAPLISAFCATARACCASFGTAALASCESQLPAQLDNFRLVQQGRLSLDSVAFAACAKAYQDAATTCVLTGLFDECRRVWVGAQKNGDPCLDVAECDRSKGPMLCLRNLATSSQSEPGLCTPAPTGALGDPCAQSCPLGGDCSSNFSGFDAEPVIAQCREQDGLYCAFGDDARCAALVPSGAACEGPNECGSANFCDTTCKALAQSGQACQFTFGCAKDLQCSSGACRDVLFATPALCSGNFNSSGLN